MNPMQVMIAAAMVGVAFFFLSLMGWYIMTNEHTRLKVRDMLTTLRLRLKFTREAVTCPVCGGQGEYPASGAFGDIDVECTRCDGTGHAYVYTYRFKWWTAKDSEQFHADQDLVETVLGKSTEQIKTKAAAAALARREEER